MKNSFVRIITGVFVVSLIIVGLGTACDSSFSPSLLGVNIEHDAIVLTEGRKELHLSIGGGSPISLQAFLLPIREVTQAVTWESTNHEVVTVSDSGLITVTTAVPNTATIIVTTNEDGFSDECLVIVNLNIPVTGISLNRTNFTLARGTNGTLVATIFPTNATNRTVTWESSNPDVAGIENGKVIARGTGTTTITATSGDGSFTATCTITVP